MHRFLVSIFLVFLPRLAHAGDPFAENIRTTQPLSPQEELKSFHIPPGFEIQLVASEPDIAKPLNMAFDSRGRLWITQTREYPFPAKDKGRDAIKIIEIGPDGVASKISTFADSLDIPIGIYPYQGGAIAHSIPKIWHFHDDNNDGKADRIEPLFGGEIGTNDTHGMVNGFRRGFDGWLYSAHNFNNTSTIIASDGSSITLNSGNTFRMKIDGSRVEQFTWGQTNPFGLCFDPLGNLYSADSHSKPIYQLLRGGYYEGIGKSDDGLGFAPHMMTHLHGSTAIGGIVYYAAEQFPKEFRDNIFVGNVVTCRINRDSLTHHGSTPTAHEEADFLRSDDPWFRPCDLQLGPDGAIYVADFYNRIIAHYEVPLNHPGRDHERGRIWRIVYIGADPHLALAQPKDLGKASTDELIEALDDPNLKVRMLATDEIVDRVSAGAIDLLKNALKAHRLRRGVAEAHVLWALHRLNALESSQIETAFGDSQEVRVHLMRILSETANWTEKHHQLALQGLSNSDPLVQRCAADAIGQHPATANISPLLALLDRADRADTHLIYVLRMSLRNQLQTPGAFEELEKLKLQIADIRAIMDVCPAMPNSGAATFLARHIALAGDDRALLVIYLRHAMRYLAGADLEPLVALMRKQFADDLDLQLELFSAVQQSADERGAAISDVARDWGSDLAHRAIASSASAGSWSVLPLNGKTRSAAPWALQTRTCADGKSAIFVTSLPAPGPPERLTGILQSEAFDVPPAMSFWLAGHNGFPGTDPPPKNFVRLRDARTNDLLAEATPPRNDVAQRVAWDLHGYANRRAYLEIIDGDDGPAYAWLALGRLDPQVVALPPSSPSLAPRRRQAACAIAGALRLSDLVPAMQQLLSDPASDSETRAAAAIALAQLGSSEGLGALRAIVGNGSEPISLREKLVTDLGKLNAPEARAILIENFRTAPAAMQSKLAQALAMNQAGSDDLLKAIASGAAPARLLLERNIVDRIAATNPPDWISRVATLTKGLAEPSDELQRVMKARRAQFVASKASAEHGAKIFAQTCAICHQIAGQGKVVGPQLDGIGARGLDRVIEDVLDPNRNLDPSFRYVTFILANNDVITALPRREEGDTLTVTDTTGKEISLSKSKIKQRIQSNASLMPDNFATAIPAQDFNDLIAYLLAQRANPAK